MNEEFIKTSDWRGKSSPCGCWCDIRLQGDPAYWSTGFIIMSTSGPWSSCHSCHYARYATMPYLFDHTYFYVAREWMKLALPLPFLSLVVFTPLLPWSLFDTKSNGKCLSWFSVPCLPCGKLPRLYSVKFCMFQDNLSLFCIWFILENPMSYELLAPCSLLLYYNTYIIYYILYNKEQGLPLLHLTLFVPKGSHLYRNKFLRKWKLIK